MNGATNKSSSICRQNGEHRFSYDILRWLAEETDEHVLGLLRARESTLYDGNDPYQWAENCRKDNPHTGLATLIRALRVATLEARDISALLGIPEGHIACFLAAFWDIGPYLETRSGINDLVRGAAYGDGEPTGLVESVLLLAGWIQGLEGII